MKKLNNLIAFTLVCLMVPFTSAIASSTDGTVMVVHANTITDPATVTPTPTPLTTPTPTPTPTPDPTPTPTPVAEVLDLTGGAFFVTPVVLNVVESEGNNFDQVGVFLTNPSSSVTISTEDNTNIVLFQNSLLSNSPLFTENGVKVSTSSLIDGKAYISVIVKCLGQYRVETPLATIIVPIDCSNKRNGRSVFQTEYNQNELNGQLKVSAISGSIQVIDREGTTTNLEAGQDHTIGNIVNRVSWILPVDGDHIYGGQVNTLAWTEYEDAIGYVIEYNSPSPFFAEDNPSTNEFPTLLQVFPVGTLDANGDPYPYTYIEPVDDVITMEIALPDVHEGVIETRVFPIDVNGNFLSDSESSDKITVTWK